MLCGERVCTTPAIALVKWATTKLQASSAGTLEGPRQRFGTEFLAAAQKVRSLRLVSLDYLRLCMDEA